MLTKFVFSFFTVLAAQTSTPLFEALGTKTTQQLQFVCEAKDNPSHVVSIYTAKAIGGETLDMATIVHRGEGYATGFQNAHLVERGNSYAVVISDGMNESAIASFDKTTGEGSAELFAQESIEIKCASQTETVVLGQKSEIVAPMMFSEIVNCSEPSGEKFSIAVSMMASGEAVEAALFTKSGVITGLKILVEPKELLGVVSGTLKLDTGDQTQITVDGTQYNVQCAEKAQM